MGVRNYFDKLKRFFWFSRDELIAFFIAVFGLAFIYSWTGWGAEKFDASVGLKNFAGSAVLVALTMFVHHAGQRLVALWFGFRVEHRLWSFGLIIGLILAVLTKGKVVFLAVSGTIAHMMPYHRIGAFRYGPNIAVISKISLAGPVANLFFSAIIKSLGWIGILSSSFADKLFWLNVVFAVWNLLPIPPLDGSNVFYHSRLTYVFFFGSFLAYVLLVYVFEFYSYILSLLIGAVLWLLFYIFFERKW